MSVPRLYETDPFHPLALFTPYTYINLISIYVQNCAGYFFHVIFTLCLEHRFQFSRIRSSPEPLILSFTAILKSFCPLYSIYWYETARQCP